MNTRISVFVSSVIVFVGFVMLYRAIDTRLTIQHEQIVTLSERCQRLETALDKVQYELSGWDETSIVTRLLLITADIEKQLRQSNEQTENRLQSVDRQIAELHRR